MSVATSYFKSTIGQKQLMGLTGLIWSGFVLSHMLGNMLIFLGADTFNKYGHAIVSNKPLLFTVEALLVASILVHVIKGILVTARNKSSRPVKPAMGLGAAKDSSFAVKTMIYQGVVILVFVILHLITFKYGTYYETTVEGVVMRDLHRLVVETFHNPVYCFWYVFSLILLGLHLSHGFYSSIQTLGIHHPKYNPKLQMLGHLYAGVVSLGFISQPIYVFFFNG
jgi:succinate dehydrogenase / fumarate reductase cytochrome b subunit